MFTLRKFIARCSSRRCADDVGSAGRFVLLLPIAHAAVHHRDTQIGETPVIPERRLDLCRELTRRLEHETAKDALLGKQGHDWQRESRCFAGAGLRGTD